MEGWSSMRFCNIKGQDSIGHLENEIHFQRRRRAGGPLAKRLLESSCS
jgi:hypothetical protein